MTLKSEIEQIRAGPGEPVPMAIAFALAFGVGVAVKEILDSRTAGAVAWILVFTGFVALGVARSLVIHPARITRRSPL